MRLFSCGLLVSVSLGVPFVSAACGGSVTGDTGDDSGTGNKGGGHDAGIDRAVGSPDVTATAQRDAAPDVATVSTTYPASHPPLPTVVSGGGPTLANPVFIPITFPGDPNVDDITTFTAEIGQTNYWSTIVTQYGVGAATSGTPIVLTIAQEPTGIGGTIDDSAVQSWLQTQLDSGGVLTGLNSPNTVFAVYFPSGTTITLQGQQSCQSFGGYHSNFTTTDTGQNVTYAVLPRCASFPTASTTLVGVDAITGPASHEYLESATDPQPETNAAYVQPDQADIIWEFVMGGGEIGDLCVPFPTAFFKPTTEPSGFTYMVQRAWSNSAALASQDPCEPEPTGEVYFNSIAVLPAATLMFGSMSVAVNAVTIPLHGSKTVEVDLYSSGPVGPWSVQAVDVAELNGGAPALSFSWNKTSGKNGDKLELTITAESMPTRGADGFMLESQTLTQATLSVGMVVVQ
jgi:hypothetical protein